MTARRSLSPRPECPDDRPSDAAQAQVAGDARVDLDQLFRERAGDLAAALRGRVRDRELVWDAVQEAFARFAALSAARREGIARPDAFLFRTGFNILTDWGRTSATATRHQQLWPAENRCDPTPALESRDLLRRLEQAVGRLRPKTREIFLAHRLDGLSYAEIAERTGLSTKGVEKHMSKAIAMIDRVAGRR